MGAMSLAAGHTSSEAVQLTTHPPAAGGSSVVEKSLDGALRNRAGRRTPGITRARPIIQSGITATMRLIARGQCALHAPDRFTGPALAFSLSRALEFQFRYPLRSSNTPAQGVPRARSREHPGSEPPQPPAPCRPWGDILSASINSGERQVVRVPPANTGKRA